MPSIALEIVPEDSGYRLRMSVGAKERELRDVDCRGLFRAAVVVAVTVTLSESAERPSAEARRETVSTPANPEPVAPAATASGAPPASNVELSFALGGGFHVGLLPKVAPLFELQAKSLFYDRVGLALAARYLARRTHDQGERGVTVDALGGQLTGRYRLSGYWEAALGGSVYRLAGTGQGLGQRSDSAWAAGPTVGLCFLPLPRSRIWIALAGEAGWNALRPRFEFENYGPIFTASRSNFALFLQVGPSFD